MEWEETTTITKVVNNNKDPDIKVKDLLSLVNQECNNSAWLNPAWLLLKWELPWECPLKWECLKCNNPQWEWWDKCPLNNSNNNKWLPTSNMLRKVSSCFPLLWRATPTTRIKSESTSSSTLRRLQEINLPPRLLVCSLIYLLRKSKDISKISASSKRKWEKPKPF